MNTCSPSQRARPRSRDNQTTTVLPISAALWAVLEPLLPAPLKTHRFGGGRPRVPDRDGAEASFYGLRTGCPGSALNQTTLCAKSTAHDRLQERVAAGVFVKRWQTGVEQCDALGGIDWEGLSRDGAMTNAPLGGAKNRPPPDRCGQLGVKRSVLTEGHGVPLSGAGEGAHRHAM